MLYLGLIVYCVFSYLYLILILICLFKTQELFFFSLPSQQFHRNEHVERNKYDAVLNDVDTMANIDCSIKFPNCPTSIWSEQFIF